MNEEADRALALIAEATGRLTATRADHEKIVAAINLISAKLKELDELKSKKDAE